MGNWYRVVKTIKGRRYAYQQRTWREGKRVRTENRYLGPVGDGDARAPSSRKPGVTTTNAAAVDGAAVETVLADLVKPLRRANVWKKSWQDEPQEENHVERIPEVDDRLRPLQATQISWTGGPLYNRERDYINVPPSKHFFGNATETATQAYYTVLFHEYAHWTGHESRLDRHRDLLGMRDYAREELVAELTAGMLMQHFQIAPADKAQRASYFQHWLGFAGDREEALAFARQEAARAAHFILTATPRFTLHVTTT